MTAEGFKQQLREKGVEFYQHIGKVSLLCPLSDHSDLPYGKYPDFIIGEHTGFGECVICRKRAGFEETLAALKERKKPEFMQWGGVPRPHTPPTVSLPAINRTESPVALPSIYSWKDFGKYQFPWANQWRVNGLIPVSARCVIAAPSGEGKSWFAMALAKSVVAGVPYLGNPAFATTQCKVLYIENETAKSDFQRRGRRLGFHEVEDNLFAPLDDWPPLNNKKTAEALYEWAKRQGIGMVIIDTFRSVAGGIKEEKAEEIRGIIDNFKPFMESGITVVILDHTRKPHPNEGGLIPKKEQLLGSQDKFAAVEAVIMLRMKPATKTEGGSTANIYAYPMKNKGGPEARPFQIDIIHVDEADGEGTTTLTYAGEIEDKVLQAAVAEDAIKDYLAGQTEPRTAAEIIEALQGKAGKTSIEAKLRELRDAKKVGFERKGQKYLYWLASEEDFRGDDLLPLEGVSLTTGEPAS